MRTKNIKLLIVGLLGLFIGCNDLDQVPTDKFTDNTFWTTAEKAQLVVNQAYNQMYNAGKMWTDEVLSDNLFEGRSNTNERSIRNGQADPSNSRFANEWKECYEGIKTCNVFMDKVDLVPGMNEEVKNRMKAEVRFIRAFLYFRLTNFYGAVPYFTTDISLAESKSIKRTPRAEIIKSIHTELEEIEEILPSRDKLTTAERGKITKGAVVALNARVYLYDSKWEDVLICTDKLINQQAVYGKYELFPSYGGLFLVENEYNQEVILDYSYINSIKIWDEMIDMAPLSAGARVNAKAPTQELVDSYLTIAGKTIKEDDLYNETNPYINRDPRLTSTIVYHNYKWQDAGGTTRTIYIKPKSTPAGTSNVDEYSGQGSNATSTGYYVKKYYDPTAITGIKSGLNIIMFRYADILLMHAEASNESDKMSSDVWKKTIYELRKRAGFTDANALNYPSLDKDAMRESIRNERRSELALEGLRYYDIIRWKAGEKYLNSYVHGAQFGNSSVDNGYIRLDNRKFNDQKDNLWSIPRSQMDLNPNLQPNNPGYGS